MNDFNAYLHIVLVKVVVSSWWNVILVLLNINKDMFLVHYLFSEANSFPIKKVKSRFGGASEMAHRHRHWTLVSVAPPPPPPSPDETLVHRRLPHTILLGFPNCSDCWIKCHLLSGEGKRLQQSFQHPATNSLKQWAWGQRDSKY